MPTMDIKQLKELIALLEKSKLHKLTIKEKSGFEVHLEKPPKDAPAAPAFYAQAPQMAAPQSSEKSAFHAAPAAKAPDEKPGDFITSPMVGTFYSAPSPEDPPFIKVGDRVEEDSVVCIIEAMKVMNEVKAGKSGVVKEVMVSSSNPVEFGTKLLRIE